MSLRERLFQEKKVWEVISRCPSPGASVSELESYLESLSRIRNELMREVATMRIRRGKRGAILASASRIAKDRLLMFILSVEIDRTLNRINRRKLLSGEQKG